MCDPVSLMVASTVASVGGQLYQGSANAAAAEYNAEVNQQNAILADRRAKDAIERGQMEEERKKREATMLMKQQEGSMAASGLDTSFGSPLDIITSSYAAAQMDAAIIRANAEREAEDFGVQAQNQRSQSRMNRMTASSARTGALLGAAGTALDGGAGVFKYRAETG